MDVLHEMLGMVDKVQSQDHIRTVMKALQRRFRELTPQVSTAGFAVGQPVSFVAQGRTIYGRVKSVNPKSISVTPLGDSQHWRVGVGLLRHETEASMPKPAPMVQRRPLIDLPKVPGFSRDPYNEEVMQRILGCYYELSPENLSCDGEIGGQELIAREREIRSRLDVAFTQFGRRVSETEAYEWKTNDWQVANGQDGHHRMANGHPRQMHGMWLGRRVGVRRSRQHSVLLSGMS